MLKNQNNAKSSIHREVLVKASMTQITISKDLEETSSPIYS
jgi:hypothetical protein